MNKRLLFIGTAVAALAVAAGCGGGGSQTSPLPQSPAGTQKTSAQGVVKLTIPRGSGSAATDKRSPMFISSNTNSFSLQVGTAAAVVVEVGSSDDCSGSPITCTVPFTGIVGDNTVTVKTFKTSDGTGTPLSQASTTVSLSAGTNTPTPLTLNPVVTQQVVTILDPSSATITADGTTQNLDIGYSLRDDANDVIVISGDSLVDSDGNPLPSATPNLTVDPDTGITGVTYAGDAAGGTWQPAFDTSQSNANVTFSVAAIAGTNIAATSTTLTVTATPGPSPSSSTAPTNVIVNGGFESSSTAISPWFVCYAGYNKTAPAHGLGAYVATDPSPVPIDSLTDAAPTAAPTTGPFTNDVSVQQSVPTGNTGATAGVHDGSNAALVGHIAFNGGTANVGHGKGVSGICQTVTVPATDPQLTLWIYEGGNTYYFNTQNHVGAVYAGDGGFPANPFASFTPDAGGTAYWSDATPAEILFAQNNCYDSLAGQASPKTYCTVGGGNDTGGQWYEKGPYDLSAYAGQQVTILLGIQGSSTSTVYYNYAYFDDVSLTGSSDPCASKKRGAQSTNGKRTPSC